MGATVNRIIFIMGRIMLLPVQSFWQTTVKYVWYDSSGMLCSVLGSPRQQRLMERSKQGATKVIKGVDLSQEKKQELQVFSLNRILSMCINSAGNEDEGVRLLKQCQRQDQKEWTQSTSNALCAQRNIFYYESGQTLEEVAHRDSGVCIHGGF